MVAVRLEAAGSFGPNCARRFLASNEVRPTGCWTAGEEGLLVTDWLGLADDGSGINTTDESPAEVEASRRA